MVPEYFKTKLAEIYGQEQEIAKDLFDFWLDEIVFSFHWWVLLITVLLFWLVWLAYHDKQKTHPLLYAGLFVALIGSYLDFLGIQAGLWQYYAKLVPTIPSFFTWDLTLLPIEVMFLIQLKPKVNPYLKALFHSLLTSLIFEPLFIWIGFYEPLKWKSLYSIPIQFAIFIIAHKLYKGCLKHGKQKSA